MVSARGKPGSGQGSGQKAKIHKVKGSSCLPSLFVRWPWVLLSRFLALPFIPPHETAFAAPITLRSSKFSIYRYTTRARASDSCSVNRSHHCFQPRVVNLKEPPCCQPCTEFIHGTGLPFHVFFGSNPSHGGSLFPVKFWVEVFSWVWGKVL